MKHLVVDRQKKELIFDIIGVVVGSFLYSLGIHMFTSPNNIAPGGVTGIATLLEYAFGFPIGLTTLVINIPILLIGWKVLGTGFTMRTLIAIGVFTVFADYITIHIPVYVGNTILASIFGGVVIGIGLGMVFARGFTTGGSDVIARLLQLKFPHFSTGKMLFIVDCIVVAISVFVFGNIETAMYALITMFVLSKMIDMIVYGGDIGRMIMIISEKSEEISRWIIEDFDRGVTLLKATGAYSGNDKNVIMVAVKKNQFYKLKRQVYRIDSAAFMIVTEAGEIVGQGFKDPNPNQN